MIGRNLLRWLRQNVAPFPTVIALGRHPVNLDDVENILLDDFSASNLQTVLGEREIDLVIHLMAAGVHPSERDTDLLTHINSDLPALIVHLAARHKAKAVVIAGSSAEYLTPTGFQNIIEQDPLEPSKVYGATKAIGGQLALQQGTSLDIPVGVARIFNVYGPGEAAHRLLPSLLSQLQHGHAVPLSLGTQIRDFIYVDDVCAGLWHMARGLMNRQIAPNAYNLCTGTGNSVADFAKAVARIGEYDASLLRFGALPLRPDDVAYLVGDPTSLQTSLGWKASYDLAAGIAASLEEISKGDYA